MWFKNLYIFNLKESIQTNWTLERLEAQLAEAAFVPCSSVEPRSEGWIAPGVEADGPLVYSANGYWLFARKTEQKLIPASVVNERLKEAIDVRENKEGRKLKKTEKEQLKDEIFHTLVTQAFSQSNVIYGYIDTLRNYLVINTSSRKKAEEFCNAMRSALGSFKVELPEVQHVPILMTEWLKQKEFPVGLTPEDQCVIEDTREGGALKISKQNLLLDEILNFIDHGREVIQMRFAFRNEIAFGLKEDLSLKSLKFLEGLQDRASDLFTETAADRFDADFTLMTESLTELIGFLFKIFKANHNHQSSNLEIKKMDEVKRLEISETPFLVE